MKDHELDQQLWMILNNHAWLDTAESGKRMLGEEDFRELVVELRDFIQKETIALLEELLGYVDKSDGEIYLVIQDKLGG